MQALIRSDQLGEIDLSPTQPSVFERLKNANKWNDFKATLTKKKLSYLRYNPKFILRPDQMLPMCASIEDQLRFFNAVGGRGLGKTTLLCFGIIQLSLVGRRNILVIAPTSSDLRSTIFEEGFAKNFPPWLYDPEKSWNRSSNTITLKNGTRIRGITGERPDRIRGVNSAATFIDEGCAMPKFDEVMAQVRLATRAPIKNPNDRYPRIINTTTPRYSETLIELVESRRAYTRTVPTYVNASNLEDDYIQDLQESVEGTDWALQEISGLITRLDGSQLWSYDDYIPFHARMPADYGSPEFHEFIDNHFSEVIVSVDPSGALGRESSKNLSKSDDRSDEIGLTAFGRLRKNRKQFALIDDWTMKGGPDEWINKAVEMAVTFHARQILQEGDGQQKGFGRFFDSHPTVREKGIEVKLVTSKGMSKTERAAAVSVLWKQKRVYHVHKDTGNHLQKIEKEMTFFSQKEYSGKNPSPDRTDSMVHAATEMSGIGQNAFSLGMFSRKRSRA